MLQFRAFLIIRIQPKKLNIILNQCVDVEVKYIMLLPKQLNWVIISKLFVLNITDECTSLGVKYIFTY